MKGIHRGKTQELLVPLKVGERVYVETLYEDVARKMQRLVRHPASRRVPDLQDRSFKMTLFTAISAKHVQDVRYLICVERVS